jgi:hypothetical protein
MFDCRVVQGAKHSPEEFENPATVPEEGLPSIGRRAIRPGQLPAKLIPETVAPSSLHGDSAESVTGILTQVYGDPLQLDLGIQGFDRGTFFHRCFEVARTNKNKLQLVAESLGVQMTDEGLGMLSTVVDSFERWLKNTLLPVQSYAELPILAQDANGTVMAGSIDLLVETAEGFWIIDHKSDQADDLEGLFAFYRPQLECYGKAYSSIFPEKRFLGIAINWVSHGKVSTRQMPLLDSAA